MSDIDWPLTEDAVMAVLKDKVNEHHILLRGNGKEGLVDFVVGLKSQMKTVMYLLILLNALALLALGIITAVIMSHKAEAVIPHISISNGPQDAYNTVQDAGVPTHP